ncbi:hypothetical protein [Pseudooceanicola algae]|uniref:Uncharacterized protein n=1 Tax=Pseudooceanicola algae TaxID=1537215 RepID=A0A418SGK6_9RHOB|nr:hypothetical protein [Pseudooceanicola algae]QPM89391.1 hypothetical protein PSAL_006070 [Pseudooceanicola algae]
MTTYPFEVVFDVAAPDGAATNPLTNLQNAWHVTESFQNILDQLTGTYTAMQRLTLGKTWLDLTDAGLLAKLDQLCIHGRTEADSLIDWTGGAASVNNGATWDSATGFTCDGISDYITMGVNPSTAGNLSQNSASYGMLILDGSGFASNDYLLGMEISGTPDNYLRAITTGGSVATRIQSGADLAGGVGGAAQEGLWIASRTGAAATALYRNGSSLLTGTGASTAVRDGDLVIGRQSATYGPANAGAWFVGAGLTPEEVEALDAILRAHVGAVVSWSA